MRALKLKDHIVFEDNDYLIINKPAGISSLSDRQDAMSVLTWSQDYWPQAQLCHRLDKQTSGAIALAKNPEAYRHLSMQFQNREVNKTYHAVVQGRQHYSEKKIELALTVGRRGLVHVNQGGKDSETLVTTLDVYKAHSLLSCTPVTGRTHQIRVHLSHVGAPIVGDLTYGGKLFYLSEIKHKYNLKKFTEEKPLMSRLALHAANLKFQLLQGKEQAFEAPYPKDFQVLIKQLNKNRPIPAN